MVKLFAAAIESRPRRCGARPRYTGSLNRRASSTASCRRFRLQL